LLANGDIDKREFLNTLAIGRGGL